MKTFAFLLLLTSTATAVRVVGAAEGFAKGVTGGGNAAEVFPKSNAELISYLGDSTPRVIVLDRTFNFIGSEGRTSATGCAPFGTGASCQTAINANNWCTNYQKNAPKVAVNYDNAALNPIRVASQKTLVGVNDKGIIQGKGLYIANGAKNIIIQNIKIQELNPQYVWGGDAIALDNADMVWIDHITTYHIGRQHVVLGNGPSNRVTISSNDFDGRSDYSATCNGKHYWALYFTGSSDLITFKNNYIHSTSGRSPKVSGNTLLHALNNYFYDNPSHAFEIGSGARILAEGNAFQNIANPIETASIESNGYIFTAPDANSNALCGGYLGRSCVLNAFGSSGPFAGVGSVDQALANFKGRSVPSAGASGDTVGYVLPRAGFGKV
ncbi:probable pectin lyase precursor [Ramularia collo-cygni]|uniref:pectin lyase n=1 Tax=Ramularia collo-cygni TaxID=112498 RepID=A0A2D3UR03_9PEZI|nr:probable pectin lyase precursor [Ramularia collo-cygni]CZT14750.1 probable pectin lyase precursor [Ramularia collo-cygni]